MITLIRWFQLKKKEIYIKLAFYSFIEQYVNEIVNNKEDIEKKLIHEIAEIIHNQNK